MNQILMHKVTELSLKIGEKSTNQNITPLVTCTLWK